MKKRVLFVLLMFVTFFISAEQLTKIGVVDISRIYKSYYKESSSMRDIQKMQEELKSTLEKIQSEIDNLLLKKAEADKNDNRADILKYEDLLDKQIKYKKQYNKTMVQKIRAKESSLYRNSKTAVKIYKTIEYVAESEGYSLVFKKTDSDLIWYNQEVDITEKVLDRLKK